MSIINIRQAEREGARLVIGLAGVSGSGKTRTAIALAFGLANYQSSKVGLLCTENKRGSLYANVLTVDGVVQRFLIGDLFAPFSPSRYKQAILEFQQTGIEVLVIDSVSHEWEGIGGCEEIATSGNPKFPRWNEAKAQHKSFMNALLQSDMHVICCMRAREKTRPVVNAQGKTVFESQGIMPICEKNFMFELTASLMMHCEGMEQDVIKCPGELLPILGRGKGYITPEDGAALRAWVDGAKALDPAVERARNSLRTVTEDGLAALQAAWKAQPKEIQHALGEAFKDELKQAAMEFDSQRKAAAPGGAALADLNSQVMAQAEE